MHDGKKRAKAQEKHGKANNQSGTPQYKCDICGQIFKQKSTRREHRIGHFNGQFECWLCHKP